MNIVTQIKHPSQLAASAAELTYGDGWDDALLGKMPRITEFSPYYSGYLAASIQYDLVPF
ncbi:MAG: hypothetical protein ACKPA7_07280 [Sphaerospermopsis kisseleviana]